MVGATCEVQFNDSECAMASMLMLGLNETISLIAV